MGIRNWWRDADPVGKGIAKVFGILLLGAVIWTVINIVL